MSMLELKNINFSYNRNSFVLKNLNAAFLPGKVYAILGASGCGKTTLLSILGGLDIPDEGSVLLNGRPINEKELPDYRRKEVAFIFQNFNLIDYLTAEENLNLISTLDALPVLEKVGIDKKLAKQNALKLSGGQQQRVAVARALISDASVLLADEPTGNLDVANADAVTKLLVNYAHNLEDKCVIIVTHSADVANQADVVLKLEGGILK
ncbi:ABC transporter ATP-binding protein [Murimonas intestini]|nr:ABC transporter ATP-binding protein [Murimonas intestini]MCR1864288.1 ABC transporter ATP-binding protein [Murimonas intestini]MCR1881898.1 ABC transporter ATP-binding protein [Murimonas intestini]